MRFDGDSTRAGKPRTCQCQAHMRLRAAGDVLLTPGSAPSLCGGPNFPPRRRYDAGTRLLARILAQPASPREGPAFTYKHPGSAFGRPVPAGDPVDLPHFRCGNSKRGALLLPRRSH